jgi:hypothetical protein
VEKKNTLQKDSAARELERERERERERGGEGRDDHHKRCEEDGEIMLEMGDECYVYLCHVTVWCLLALPTQANDFVFRFIIEYSSLMDCGPY